MHICYDCFKQFEETESVCPHCGQTYNPQPDVPIHLMPGTILAGRYVIGRAVGSGGFGIVYRAWDQKLEVIVAVKEFFANRLVTRAVGQNQVIVNKKAQDEFEYRKTRFLTEARYMAKFGKHPNIPNVYEFFEDNGTAYIVMELLHGVALNEYLVQNSNNVDPDFAVFVASEIGKALKSLHSENIIHCDVAPDNIFLVSGKEVRVLLMDLGAAKLADSQSEVIDIILKPGFSPTEQYDKSQNIGPWTDIYALGATLYMMLTGIKPCESTNRKIEDTLQPPQEINPLISDNLNNTILKAMAIDRHMRFRNVKELVQAINGDRKVISLKKEKKKRNLRRALSVCAALMLVTVAGIGVYRYYDSKHSLEVLDPATISLWYCADEDSDENSAMLAIKDDFEKTFEGVIVEVEGFPEEEYEKKLEEALEKNALPTVFESTGVSSEILEKASELDEVTISEQFQQALFLQEYESEILAKKQIPLAINIPLACVITNGPTCIEYEDDYFSSIDDFQTNDPIAVSEGYENLIEKNFSSNDFAEESAFLDSQNNTSAVLLTSTKEINEIKLQIKTYDYSFVYYDSKEIICDYTYEWSIGHGTKDEIVAGERLLSFMLGNVYQSYLMISECNEGYIPVNEICFNSKIQEKNLMPIQKIYKKFKFSEN